MNISYFLCGAVTVSVSYEESANLLNLCMYYCIPYTDFKIYNDRITAKFRLSSFKKLMKEATARGIELTVEKKEGIPIFFDRYKYRYGIFVGAVAAFVLVFLSQQFIWDINVTGNENITSSEIRTILESHDFGIGTYIPSVNTDRIENKLLIDSETISWISINIVGTVAEVQIREYEKAAAKETETRPANLVAKKSGLVEEVRIYRGNVVVGAGKYVEKGDLLVSGLYDSERVGFRYTRAAGQVMARTTTEYFIEIPYEYEGIEYTGREYYDKYLNFFDFSINISKKCSEDMVFYDKIDTVENCCLPDGRQTPFEIHTVKYVEYLKKTMYRTEAEAEELAYFELSEKLSEISDNSIIIRKTITPSVKEDRFILQCVVVAIEDIASVAEFDVDMSMIGTDNEKDRSEKGRENEQ